MKNRMKKTMKIGFVFLLSLLSIGAIAQSNEGTVRGSVSTNLPDNGKVRTSTVRGVLNDVIDYAAQRTPYLTRAQLQAGKADTARVVHITDAGRAGTFVYNSTSGATDDGAMVLVSSGRRYIRVVDGPIKAEWFGAVGDGTTNDHAALTAFMAYPGSVHLLEAGKTYKVNGTLVVENTTLDLNGSTLAFATTGATAGLRAKSNSAIVNGTVSNTVTSPAGSGEFGCAIILGEYGTTAEVKNVTLDKLTLSMNRPNGNVIGMLGNVHDVEITNLTFPASSTAGRAILAHWGNANIPQRDYVTTHPYNIKISNVNIGAMTYATSPSEMAGIFLSAVRNVEVTKVKIAEAVNGLVIYAGDFGFDSASVTDKASAYKGIVVRDVIADNITRHGIDLIGNAYLASGKQTMPVLVDNCSFNSITRASRRGINISSVRGPKIQNSKFSGFFWGVIDAGLTDNVTVENNLITNCEWPYHLGGVSSGYSTGWVVTNNKSIGNTAVPGNTRGSFYLEYSRNAILENNYVQDSTVWGFRLADSCKTATLKNNHVELVRTGGVAYSNGLSTNYLTLANFQGNTYKAGITPTGGMTPIIVETRPSGTRRARGARPTTGSWIAGDFVEATTYTRAGTAPNRYVITGWLRLTTGSGNVLDTDWVEARTLTGN